MKIKSDFITNSSSTCFILISPGEFTKSAFFNAAGLANDSLLAQYFSDLYHLLEKNKQNMDEYLEHRPWKKEGMSDDLMARIELAKRVGHFVYMGNLSSDGDESESFFCQDSFIIDGNDIYIDALECVW